MRVPVRRSETLKITEPPDRFVTQEALDRMKKTLDRLIKVERPLALAEVQRTAEMGDLSENFGHYVAKTALRSMDGKIEHLKDRITNAVVIGSASPDGKVHVGSTVTLLLNGLPMTVTILGSLESSPSHGRISRGSPLGAALLGHCAGDVYEKYLGSADARIEIQNVA